MVYPATGASVPRSANFAVLQPGHPHRHFRIRVRDAGGRTLGPDEWERDTQLINISGSFEQSVGRDDRTPLPSAVLRKVQMDI